MTGYDGVVLAGGRARRLGGVDKPGLEVGGRRLIDTAVAALAGADRIVVVGPPTGVPGVVSVRESPPGGGPVAALAAGLAECSAPLIVVLAADLPFVTAAAVAALVAAAAGGSAMAVDEGGRDQPLLAAYAVAAILAALPADPGGARLRTVTDSLPDVSRVKLRGEPWFDCDTPEELATARQRGAT